jgi:1-aminocyclopropane-1-carboxylate deaminase
MMIYHETPVQELHDPLIDRAGIRLLIKREDLNHPHISGNKWWKLKYNLNQAKSEGKKKILTFGGAYSNHIYAAAAAANDLGLESIGIIRGEEAFPLNNTLSFAKSQGMEIVYVTREDYKKKHEKEFVKGLRERFGDFYLIPEGGTNLLAVKGCGEFAAEKLSKIGFEHLFLAVGTGGTMAGIVSSFAGRREITGIPVLKSGEFLREEISNMIFDFTGQVYGNWRLLTSYHHGGYAKVTTELLDFVSAMKKKHSLPLDHVYTGKLMWAVMKEIEAGNFRRGSTILVLHSGGLQGAMQ